MAGAVGGVAGAADRRGTVVGGVAAEPALVVLVLGTLVIFTFDPCADPNSTLDVCRSR